MLESQLSYKAVDGIFRNIALSGNVICKTPRIVSSELKRLKTFPSKYFFLVVNDIDYDQQVNVIYEIDLVNEFHDWLIV